MVYCWVGHSPFRFCCKMLWENPNKLCGQSSTLISCCGAGAWLWFSCSVTSSRTVLGAFCSVRLSLMSSSLLVCDLRKAVACPDGSFILSEAGKRGERHKASPHLASSESSLTPQTQADLQIFPAPGSAFVPVTCPGEQDYHN